MGTSLQMIGQISVDPQRIDDAYKSLLTHVDTWVVDEVEEENANIIFFDYDENVSYGRLEETLESLRQLGRYVTEGSIIECEDGSGDRWEEYIGPDDQKVAVESRYALAGIETNINKLTQQDREKLIQILTSPDPKGDA